MHGGGVEVSGSLQIEHGVDLGQEEEDEGHGVVESENQSQRHHLEELPGGHEVGGDEAEQDDQDGADAHGDEARLVEVVGKVARLEGQQRADGDQQEVEGHEGREAGERHVTGQLHVLVLQVELGQFVPPGVHRHHYAADHHLREEDSVASFVDDELPIYLQINKGNLEEATFRNVRTHARAHARTHAHTHTRTHIHTRARAHTHTETNTR